MNVDEKENKCATKDDSHNTEVKEESLVDKQRFESDFEKIFGDLK